MSWSSCTQGTPAGFPSGMPGIGLVIEGATQHAPHRGRHDGSSVFGAAEESRARSGMAGLSSRVARRRQPA